MNNIEFKDFIQLQRGFDLPEQNRKMGNIPIVAATSIIGYHNEAKVKAPGVVTGRSGALGSVQFINEDFWPLNTTLWVKDFKGNNPKYVYYFLKTLDFKRFNSGAGVPTLNRNDLDTLQIQIHPYKIQCKIAKILSNYDNLIENNNKRIKILEDMAQKIYKEWFIDFKYPGHETVTFKDTELGKIPNDWEIVPLETIVSFENGYAFKSETYGKDGKYEIVTIKNVQDGFFMYEGMDKINTLPNKIKEGQILKEKDIILSLTGNVGRVCMIYGNNYLLNQRVAKIKANTPEYYSFVYSLFRNEKFFNEILLLANGAAQQNLSTRDLEKKKIIEPSEQLLFNYNKICNDLLNSIIVLNKRNKLLKQTRDLLLPRLISGEIDVENLEIK